MAKVLVSVSQGIVLFTKAYHGEGYYGGETNLKAEISLALSLENTDTHQHQPKAGGQAFGNV